MREVYGIDARVIPGDEEARLTFLGATAAAMTRSRRGRRHRWRLDGDHHRRRLRVSLQMGVVRSTERHLHHDPPEPAELQRLTGGVREAWRPCCPPTPQVRDADRRRGDGHDRAAIAHESSPYDPDMIHGAHSPPAISRRCSPAGVLPNAERREVRGTHPDRAPTIVAGITILLEVTRAFGLDEIEISEHDILLGAALDEAKGRAGTG